MWLFSLKSFVSDFGWRWHTQHWPSILWDQTSCWSFDDHQLSASLSRLSWLLLYDCSLLRKLWSYTRERTQNGERRSWGQLLSHGYWSHTQRNSYEELSRGCWQSHSCISILWSSSVSTTEQRSLDLTHGSILARSYSCDFPRVAHERLSWKVSCEFGSQECRS